MSQTGGPVDQVRRLVDQYDVRQRPARRAGSAGRFDHHDQLLFFRGEDPGRRGGQELRVGEQPEHQLHRVDLGPQTVRVRLHGLAAGDGVLHPVVGGVAGRLHPDQHLVGEPLRQHRPPGLVPDTALGELVDDLVGEVAADPPLVRPARHHQRLGRAADVAPDGAAQHLGHPCVALDQRRGHQIEPADLGAGGGGDERGHRRLGGVDLAQGGQHIPDVGEEAVVRTDHQHPGAGELLAVGVQEVGGAVQPDRGLAGAGGALDAERVGQPGPDDPVLLGLDGGHDVAHRAGPGTLDLGLEDLRLQPVSVPTVVRSSSSYAVSCPWEKPNRRRDRTPIGSPGRAW